MVERPRKHVKPSEAVSLVARIERRIYSVRAHKVMIDSDLATLYQVHTKALNQAVRRNKARFPLDFMFQLTAAEAASLRSQFVTSNRSRGGRRYLPYVFTQEGVAMLSSVLRSRVAAQVNIAIMRAFVRLREAETAHKDLARKIEALERKYNRHDAQIKTVFHAMRKLIEAPAPSRQPRIGFTAPHDHPQDSAGQTSGRP
jgi:ORF6N domain-containing protein